MSTCSVAVSVIGRSFQRGDVHVVGVGDEEAGVGDPCPASSGSSASEATVVAPAPVCTYSVCCQVVATICSGVTRSRFT